MGRDEASTIKVGSGWSFGGGGWEFGGCGGGG